MISDKVECRVPKRILAFAGQRAYTADRGGYNMLTYALAILWHILNILINMR